MIKEKILFPLLDGTVKSTATNFREVIKPFINSTKGEYIFKENKPPIIPVSKLLYYDETKEKIPYNFSIQQYIRGKSLNIILEEKNLTQSKTKFVDLFYNMGNILGKLHSIKFDSFQDNLYDIGKESTTNWIDVFKPQLDLEIQELRKNKLDTDKEIANYFKDHDSLLKIDQTPVLIHDDYQLSNIIAKENAGKIQINGIIDFDDWKIGVKAQDFVKLYFYTFNVIKNSDILNSFLKGYKKYQKVPPDFNNQIDLYTAFWLLKIINFEYLKNKQNEWSISLSQIDYYRRELKKIISN